MGSRAPVLALLVYSLLVPAPAGAGRILTLAGNGAPGSFGDGLVATLASLNLPESVAMGPNGELYIADQANARVRKVDGRTGVITTAAGTGRGGFRGDGGPAVLAHLYGPSVVAIDGRGALLVLDTGNDRVRRVDPASSLISTIIGRGGWDFSGDGRDAREAVFANPVGMAVGPDGSIYVSDMWNHRVRRMDASSGAISTVTGDGEARFSGDGGPAASASLNLPDGLFVAPSGDLYISDAGNHRIRRVDARTGMILTVAGNGTPGFSGDGGAAVSASLREPHGLCVSLEDDIFIADKGNHRIRRVDGRSGAVSTVAGTGKAGYNGDFRDAASADLNGPEGVCLDAGGNLLIADTNNHRIRKVSPAR